MYYHLVQLGCQMNRSDAERIATVLNRMGYEACEREEDAQLLGVVACSVRQKAIDKVYSKISKWNTWKTRKHVLTFLSGCVLPEDKVKFMDRFDLVFALEELSQLPELINHYGVASPYSLSNTKELELAVSGPLWIRKPHADTEMTHIPSLSKRSVGYQKRSSVIQALQNSTLESIREMQAQIKLHGGAERLQAQLSREEDAPVGGFWNIPAAHQSSFEAFIPIQNGCDKYCTYCAVPYTRGREVSRPAREILSELEDLVARGYKSITLLGQNVNSYGKEAHSKEPEFAQLLSEAAKIAQAAPDPVWIYFTSPHPRDMDRKIFETIAQYPNLAKQLHLPLQSGDDKVLMRMNRAHNMDRYRALVQDFRSILPDATLFTDIIVGFSQETEDQFMHTLEAMDEFSYQMAFIAMYSPRPGAASSRWDDDVPLEEKKRRLQVLTEALHRSSLSWNQKYLGRTLPALVEGLDRNSDFVSARTEGKIQVRFQQNQAQLPLKPGDFVQLRITKVQALSMEGEQL